MHCRKYVFGARQDHPHDKRSLWQRRFDLSAVVEGYPMIGSGELMPIRRRQHRQRERSDQCGHQQPSGTVNQSYVCAIFTHTVN